MPQGKPINILSSSADREINVQNLNDIFNHPEIQDRKVVILSLIGAFRGGKSFFLDYCLRFLYAHFPSINNPWESNKLIFEKNDDWMGESDKPLTGFSWQSGARRDTTGIIMWSDVFLHTMNRTGEKIAIFVMDTQGLFDNESTPADNSRIFALGTLISSVPILNLMNHIQEDHLEYLQFATEFAQHTVLNTEASHGRPFQNLMFLVRDWINARDFEYGVLGGEQYIQEVLRPRPGGREVIHAVRETINNSFDQIRCCLLPHPGLNVTIDESDVDRYDGNWSAMNPNFRRELKNVIECILLPDNMVIKKINGMDVTVKEMKLYIQAYFILFQSNDVPVTLSIYQLTVERFMSGVIQKCKDDYKLSMFRNADLRTQNIHGNCKARALILFDKERKMGNVEYLINCKAELSTAIDKIYREFEKLTKQEREQLQAALDREELQRQEAEQIRNQLEDAKATLDINSREYKIIQERLEAEELKLQEIKQKLRDEEEFRRSLVPLAAAASITAAAGVLIYTSVPQQEIIDAIVGEVTEGSLDTLANVGTEIVEEASAQALEQGMELFTIPDPSFIPASTMVSSVVGVVAATAVVLFEIFKAIT